MEETENMTGIVYRTLQDKIDELEVELLTTNQQLRRFPSLWDGQVKNEQAAVRRITAELSDLRGAVALQAALVEPAKVEEETK